MEIVFDHNEERSSEELVLLKPASVETEMSESEDDKLEIQMESESESEQSDNSDNDETMGTDLQELSDEEMDRWMLVKLVCGWTKRTLLASLTLAKRKVSWRKWYSRMRKYYSTINPQDTTMPLNGGFVSDLEKLFLITVEWYVRENLFDIPLDATELLWFIFTDGRNVWGKNEVIAFGPKQVHHLQSPLNIWPLMMVKWKGKETFQKLQECDRQLALSSFIQKMNGKLISVGNRKLILRFPIITDWMSLLPIMHNTADPQARVTVNGVNPVICGLCGFSGSDKVHGWKLDVTKVWNRLSPDSPLWANFVHLFGATPEMCVWEPLHCHTRVLDTFVHWLVHQNAGGRMKEGMHIIKVIIKRKYIPTTSFTIKEVI